MNRTLAVWVAIFAAVGCTANGPLVSKSSPSPVASSPSPLPSASVSAGPTALPSEEPSPTSTPASTPSPVQPGPGSWLRWKLMSAPRADFAATLLPSGKVLLAGGLTLPAADTASVDLFDPVTNSVTPVSPMKTARNGHSATLLPNGQVLVVGGSGSAGGLSLASAEIYDLTLNAWEPVASMSAPRTHHTALLLQGSGKVLVVGGSTQTATAEVYDIVTNTWTTVPAPTNEPRPAVPTATQLPDGHVIIAGGVTGGGSDVWVYDPHTGLMGTDRFHTNGSGRNFATATLLGNGTVLMTGGQDSANPSGALNTTDIYDVALDSCTFLHCSSFSYGNPMNVGHCHHTMTTLRNGLILVAGGRCGTAESIAVCELYDPAAKTWWPAGELQDPVGYHAAVLLGDGRVLVAGGIFPGGTISSVTQIYAPA